MTIPSIFKEKKSDLILLTIFSLAIILSRLPFMSHFLYEWDSVNYALAFQHFNIYLSQPQPPGYIFFIALGKVVNSIFNNPNTSMIFISIVFSILTIFLIYFLGKQMFSREIAIVASILLIFDPIFWFYGETATIYMSEALFATLIAYSSYQFLRGDNRFLYISSVVLGLSGGFRPDLIVFMFPLWLFCLVYREFDYKKIVKAFGVLIASVMVWFIPTIILSGGLRYYLLDNTQLVGSFGLSSIFFGANLSSQLIMDNMVLSWTILGIGILSIIVLLLFISFNLKKVFNLSNLKNSKTIFLILWIILAFLFYILIFIGQPGYTLVYLPVFALVIGYAIVNLSSDLNRKIKRIPKNYVIILLISLYLLTNVTQFITSDDPNNVDYANIKIQDIENQYINDSIKEFNPVNTVVFYESYPDLRKSMYYYPNYESYCYSHYNSSGTTLLDVKHYKNNELESYQGQTFEIHMNSSTNNIIWIVNVDSEFFKLLQSKTEVKTITLPDGNVIYYSNLNNNTNFTIDNVTFIKD